MKSVFKTVILAAGLAILGSSQPVAFINSAQASFADGSFIIDAYYYQGQISLPEDDSGIRASTQAFAAPVPKSYPFDTAELYDSANKLLISSPIDQKSRFGTINEPAVSPDEAWVRITTPYDKNAAKIVIKNETGQVVFNETVYNSFCGTNTACQPPAANKAAASPAASSGTSVLIAVLVLAGVVVLAVIIWIVIRNRLSGYDQ